MPAWLWIVSAAFLLAGAVLIPLGAIWKRSHHAFGEIAADAGIALLTGAVVAFPIFIAAETLEDRRFDQAESLEEHRIAKEIRRDNIRFVREVATQPAVLSKPFGELDLRDAQLSRLDLSGADLHGTDLRGAYMFAANLSGANIVYAKLSDANLHATDLSGADLIRANLARADLRGAKLAGADFSRATLAGVDLTDATYDEQTVWPEGFRPPARTSQARG